MADSTNSGSNNDHECSGHGDWIEEDEVCTCDWGWYDHNSENCNNPGKDVWDKEAWKAFTVIFTILHIILFLVSLYKLYSTLNQDKIKNVRRLLHRMFRSPRNLCLVFLASIGLFRFLWLRIDPFSFEGLVGRTGDRLLYETVYPFIYGLYSSVLLVWGGLYQGMRPKSSDPFKILRTIIMIMMVLAFPVSITISILKGARISRVWMPIAGIFVAAGILTLIVGFISFGILLYCYVEKKHQSQVEMQKVPCEDEIPEEILEDHSDKDSERSNAKLNSKSDRCEKVETRGRIHRFSLAKQESKGHKSHASSKSWEEFISFENEKQINESNKNSIIESEEYEILPKKKNLQDSKASISMITDDDKVIFRKLCVLLMISIMLGILVLIFMIFLNSTQGNFDNRMELGMLYIVFLIELFACWMIFFVFTAQIKVKEKNNLRFFTMISMKMNRKEPKIKLPPELRNIRIRLRKFYS
jgi:hypothetical protein